MAMYRESWKETGKAQHSVHSSFLSEPPGILFKVEGVYMTRGLPTVGAHFSL